MEALFRRSDLAHPEPCVGLNEERHWVWSNGSGCFSPVTSPAEEQSVREALSEITCCGGVQWQSLLCVCVCARPVEGSVLTSQLHRGLPAAFISKPEAFVRSR